MDSVFYLKLFLSFLIGGSWVLLSTFIADRFGSKIGGLISGLPSTVLFGLLFMAWTQTPVVAVAATTIFPAAEAATTFFVMTYILLVQQKIWKSLGIAFIVWFTIAFGLIYTHFTSYIFSFVIYLISLLVFYVIVEKRLHINSIAGAKIQYTPRIIFLRGVLSGFVIAIAVFLGKLGGPLFGGISSAFPAMFTSTIIITYFSRGASFSAATIKSSIFSFISGVIYSIGVRYTYLPLGILWGTLISVLLSLISSALIYKIIIKRLK